MSGKLLEFMDVPPSSEGCDKEKVSELCHIKLKILIADANRKQNQTNHNLITR